MTTLLEEALEAWAFTRDGVVSETRNLAEVDLAFRPAPGSRTAAELLQHILESGALMAGELSREDGDFQRKSYAALLREHGRGFSSLKTRARLLAGLDRIHRDGAGRIRKAGEIHMLQEIRQFDGRYGTRLAWMHHGISHEEYHRGQLALYARLVGKTPALTKRIRGGG